MRKLFFAVFGTRLSLNEQMLFAKRLSLLIKAGVPLFKAISILQEQASSGAKRKMFQQIANDVANGKFLSKALSRFKNMFGDFAINIIRVGETSGNLAENLKYLAEEIDKKRKLRQKLTGALLYPAVIMVSAFSLSGLMTIYLFPKLLPIFKSLHVELPFMTRILIALSAFLLGHWIILLAGALVLAGAFRYFLGFTAFRFVVHAISLKIPIVGHLLLHYHLINISRTLGTLSKSQVHMLEAVAITADISPNLLYQKELHALCRSITRGGSIAKHLEKNQALFPRMFSQMVLIGETTGNLSDMFLYLGEMYEQELDEQTKRLSSLVEPVMMLFMGLLVGFIAVSIITPIYEVTQHLNPR